MDFGGSTYFCNNREKSWFLKPEIDYNIESWKEYSLRGISAIQTVFQHISLNSSLCTCMLVSHVLLCVDRLTCVSWWSTRPEVTWWCTSTQMCSQSPALCSTELASCSACSTCTRARSSTGGQRLVGYSFIYRNANMFISQKYNISIHNKNVYSNSFLVFCI